MIDFLSRVEIAAARSTDVIIVTIFQPLQMYGLVFLEDSRASTEACKAHYN